MSWHKREIIKWSQSRGVTPPSLVCFPSKISWPTDVTVIGVHHHGKDPSRGAAGSYALTAAPDSILSVFKKGKEGIVSGRYITLTKSRFGETGRKFAFELDILPPDHCEEEGDDQAFVVPLLSDTSGLGDSKSKKSKPSASHGEGSFQSAFEALLKDEGIDSIHADEGAVRAVSLAAIEALRDRSATAARARRTFHFGSTTLRPRRDQQHGRAFTASSRAPSARILAPRIRLPNMTSRDLLLMAGYSTGFCPAAQRH